MIIGCTHEHRFGPDTCLRDCRAIGPDGVFTQVTVAGPADLPPADPHIVDVALLDMHHGWPNLGHDAMAHLLKDAACDLASDLRRGGLAIRVLSFDVRRGGPTPEPPGERFRLYIGTGGPGHLDPHRNDGVAPGSQGIAEDPSWEPPLFELFDAIRAHPTSALIGVCHTFGVMCRWIGVARPVLRGPEKGKSAGVLENALTDAGRQHPWFGRFSALLPTRERFRVLDNRLYDLVPTSPARSVGIELSREVDPATGQPGDALTALEIASDPGGVMPRIFGVNHHPEIVNRRRLLHVLREKRERDEVSEGWYEERRRTLTQEYPEEDLDESLHLTSAYTLIAPLRFHLFRQVRERLEALGLSPAVREDDVFAEIDVIDQAARARLAGHDARRETAVSERR